MVVDTKNTPAKTKAAAAKAPAAKNSLGTMHIPASSLSELAEKLIAARSKNIVTFGNVQDLVAGLSPVEYAAALAGYNTALIQSAVAIQKLYAPEGEAEGEAEPTGGPITQPTNGEANGTRKR